MFTANLPTSSSLITPSTSTSKHRLFSPRFHPTISIQSRAPDYSAASSSSSSPSWFQFPDISGPRIPRENDAVSGDISSSSSSDSNDSKLSGKREKWSRTKESYLVDDSEPLPLPMTYADITPTSLDEIQNRLSCNPKLEDCKVPVFEWTGKCRSCQGSGYVDYYSKRGRSTCKCIPCMGIGYVHKISARKEFISMEDQ